MKKVFSCSWIWVVNVQPTLVVGVDIAPLVLEFVSERPKELTLNLVVEGTQSATTELADFEVAEVGSVTGAFTIAHECLGVPIFKAGSEGSKC